MGYWVMEKNRPFNDTQIERVFNSFDPTIKKKLLLIRDLIFNTANEIDSVGKITETLKWNEPSYTPVKAKIGSPIRLNSIKNKNQFAVYFNCQTTLVSTFKMIYPKIFNYGGNRSIIFNANDKIPLDKLKHCISMALTYHISK